MRNDNVDQAPELDTNGRERQGCGAATSSPETYWANQQNAMLLGQQLRNICLYGKGYGVQAWQSADVQSDNWQTESYQNHFLAPFQLL